MSKSFRKSGLFRSSSNIADMEEDEEQHPEAPRLTVEDYSNDRQDED